MKRKQISHSIASIRQRERGIQIQKEYRIRNRINDFLHNLAFQFVPNTMDWIFILNVCRKKKSIYTVRVKSKLKTPALESKTDNGGIRGVMFHCYQRQSTTLLTNSTITITIVRTVADTFRFYFIFFYICLSIAQTDKDRL